MYVTIIKINAHVHLLRTRTRFLEGGWFGVAHVYINVTLVPIFEDLHRTHTPHRGYGVLLEPRTE